MCMLVKIKPTDEKKKEKKEKKYEYIYKRLVQI